jgi:xanthine/CO dehydrogenase XdhC/CoxF family maturation factor/CTP:molybdopterin cytidylyltransferase MocA
MKELQSIIDAYGEVEKEGERAALATVVKATGSTYRRAGARMLITADGQMVGSVSGGCLERDVREQARGVLQSNEPRVISYDSMSDHDIVWGSGLGCNGIVEVLIEPLSHNGERGHMTFLADCLRRRQTAVLATVFAVEGRTKAKVGNRLMVSEQSPARSEIGDSDLAAAILGDSQEALESGRSRARTYEMTAGHAEVFIEVIQPPLPLVIFGAGHDAVPLVHLAKELGWHVTLVDPRPGYATRMRFPSADALIVCPPEEVLARVEIDRRTVAAIMTHNYLHDLELLRTLLPTPLRYIGILGPKRRTRRLLDDIQENGLALREERNNRLYGPIGLDIGADTPEEIALAVVAEITAVLAGRSGGVRNREGPLHQPSEAADVVKVSGNKRDGVLCASAGTAEEEAGVWEEKRAPSVAIIILAAGASTRMGRPKQLLTYGGRTFLRNAAEMAVASGCRPIIAVLGAYEDQLQREIGGLPVQSVVNERWAEGLGSSIRVGVEALEHGDREGAAEAVVLMLCDQPFVTDVVINNLVTAYRSSGKGIIASEYGGTMGVPALFGREYFAKLAALGGAAGAQQIIAAHASDIVRVPFPNGTTDIDTPEDYLGLQHAILAHTL